MTFATDLLAQAGILAHQGAGRPNQASVRRSISTAYYACFHLLTGAAAREVVRGTRPVEREAIRRSITHDDMKQVCLSPGRWWPDPLLPPDLATVTRLFVRLQEARHIADYSLISPIRRPEAVRRVAEAQQLFDAWARVKDEPAARAFLVALLALRGFRRL